MKIAHVTSGVVRLLFVIVTAQPPLPAARPTTPRLFPVVTQKLTAPAVGGEIGRASCRERVEISEVAASAVNRYRRQECIGEMDDAVIGVAKFEMVLEAK